MRMKRRGAGFGCAYVCIYVCAPRWYDRPYSFNTAITLGLIINALIYVSMCYR